MGVTSESLRCPNHHCPYLASDSFCLPISTAAMLRLGDYWLDHTGDVRISVKSSNHDDSRLAPVRNSLYKSELRGFPDGGEH